MSKLSVILPVYNTEPFLYDSINSVVNQSYQDIEIIIVNDCSTDNSERIIQEFSQKDSRIKCVSHAHNKGLYQARKTGVEHCSGEYVLFVDSDDAIAHDLCMNLVRMMDGDPDCITYHVESVFPKKIIVEDRYNRNYKNYTNDEFFYAHLNLTVTPGALFTKVFKKQILFTVYNHLTMIDRLDIGEDIITSFYASSHCQKVVHLNYVGYSYNKKNDSLTRGTYNYARATRRLENTKTVISVLKQLLENHNIDKSLSYPLQVMLLDHYFTYKTRHINMEHEALIKQYVLEIFDPIPVTEFLLMVTTNKWFTFGQNPNKIKVILNKMLDIAQKKLKF